MFKLDSLRKAFLTVTGFFILISHATAPTVSQAQQQSADIPLIVMGEDSDPMSVARTSEMFQRVVSSLREQMSHHDFHVIDEEVLAAEMGWQIRARRPKVELIEVGQLVRQSGDPRRRARAMVVFKIRASARNIGFATKAMARMTGEIYDYQARRFIGSWEAPRMEFPAPANCGDKCIEDVIGDNAHDVAARLGDILREKLAYLTRVAGGPVAPTAPAPTPAEAVPAPTATAPAAQAAPVAMASACPAALDTGLSSTYSIVMRNFTAREYLEITNVMEREFPCFVTTRNPSGDSSVRVYGYVSRASVGKLEEWLSILLADMGLDPDNRVKMVAAGTQIEIDKISGSPPQTQDRAPRFQ